MFELAAANREIEALRRRLEELEMAHLAQINAGLPNYHHVNQNKTDGTNVGISQDERVKARGVAAEPGPNGPSLPTPDVDVMVEDAGSPTPRRRSKWAPAASVSPLRGCKCRSCLLVHPADASGVAARAVPPR